MENYQDWEEVKWVKPKKVISNKPKTNKKFNLLGIFQAVALPVDIKKIRNYSPKKLKETCYFIKYKG